MLFWYSCRKAVQGRRVVHQDLAQPGAASAAQLGVAVERVRLQMVLVAVGMTAIATAAAGGRCSGHPACTADATGRRTTETRWQSSRPAVGRSSGCDVRRSAEAGRRAPQTRRLTMSPP